MKADMDHLTSRPGETLSAPLPEWDHKDEWRLSGRNFLIVVSRHYGTADHYEGPHRWAVYAYIYPQHPYFALFEGPHMWQDAAVALPFHGGPSYLEYPMYGGKVGSVKVGAAPPAMGPAAAWASDVRTVSAPAKTRALMRRSRRTTACCAERSISPLVTVIGMGLGWFRWRAPLSLRRLHIRKKFEAMVKA